MSQNALILPGWYESPEANWYPWLKKELETKHFSVTVPDLPTNHTDAPDMNAQIEAVQRLNIINSDTIVFGHSLGCLLGMRLAEILSFKSLFLVAGWDFNDLTAEHQSFWKNPIDHTAIKQHVSHIYCISSDNDPYFTQSTVEAMSKRLEATYMLIKDAGHFTEKFHIRSIPELLHYI